MTGLVAVIVGLAILNLVFAGLVVVLRIFHGRRAARLERRRRRWQPALIRLISDGSDPVDLSRQVDPAEQRDVVEIAWNIARRLRGADRERIRLFANRLLGVVKEDLDSPRAETRARALQVVSCLGADDDEETIGTFLDDASTLVSLVAARALCEPHRAPWMSEVLSRLDRYASWNTALTSSMLANVGAVAAPAMRHYLGDAHNPLHGRVAVARALELLRDAESADVAAAQSPGADPELIAACLRLLAVVGRGTHAVAVRPLLTDERFFVRSAAITTLGRLGTREDARAIVQIPESDSPWVAIRSAQALADLHASDELALLVERGGLLAEAAIETLYGGAA